MKRHIATDHIIVLTDRCNACGKCVESCPKQVLGNVHVFRHRHAHVDREENCVGCMKCVKECPQQAIIRRADLESITVRGLRDRGHPAGRRSPGWSVRQGNQAHLIGT